MSREDQLAEIFVYGTLRKGFVPHSYLHGWSVRFLGEGTIAGILYDLGEYPGAVPSDDPDNEIRGELYELTDPENQLRVLDGIEEFDSAQPETSLFVRKSARVRLRTGKEVAAWVYFLPRKPRNARLIASGDFAAAHS